VSVTTGISALPTGNLDAKSESSSPGAFFVDDEVARPAFVIA
jgi:hypothetical protein